MLCKPTISISRGIALILVALLIGCAQAPAIEEKKVVYISTSSETGSYTRLVKTVFQETIPKRLTELKATKKSFEERFAAGAVCLDSENKTSCIENGREKIAAFQTEISRLQKLGFDKLEFRACGSSGSSFNLNVLRGEQVSLEPDFIRGNAIDKSQKGLLDDCRGKNVQFAIIQNDIAYRATKPKTAAQDGESAADYLDFQQLRAVTPLFPGYIQMAKPIPGYVEEFSALTAGQAWRALDMPKIALGAKSSATPKHASKVIANTKYGLGKRQFIDFEPIYNASGDCFSNTADFVMRSTNIVTYSKKCNESYQQISLPEDVVNSLANRFDYYEKRSVPAHLVERGIPEDMLSVTTYLMTVEQTDKALVKFLTQALVGAWPELTEAASDQGITLIPIEQSIQREPVAFHRGAKEVFLEKGWRSDAYWSLMVLFVSVLVVTLVIIATYFQSSYGRIGTLVRGSFVQQVADRVVGGAFWLLLIALAGIAISLAITGLQYVEQLAARDSNTVNEFAGISFVDAFVWIFTFMVSGHENDIYPQSVQGRVLISFIALLGLIVPLTGTYGAFNSARDRRALRDQGLVGLEHFHSHIVICGWNTSAAGIIWSLSGGQRLTKQDLVVVGEFDEDEPMRARNFNKRVHYCRGNPTDREVLAKAGIESASTVIILASGNEPGDKISDAITALAVREINPKILVIAEQTDWADDRYLKTAEVDIIVQAEHISDRLISAGLVDGRIVDFVFDAITEDRYSGWRVEAVSKKRRMPSWIKHFPQPLDEARVLAKARGTNLIGNLTNQPSSRLDKGSWTLDTTSERVDFFTNAASGTNPFKDGDQLVVTGPRFMNQRFRRKQKVQSGFSENPEHLLKEQPQKYRFSLVGSSRRTLTVASSLTSNKAAHDVEEHHFDLSQPFDADRGARLVEQVCAKAIDGIALLGEPAGNAMFDPKFANMLDERIVLLIKMLRDRLGPKAIILAELHSLRNRSLFMAAGATNVIPVNLLAERFITRLAVGDKAMCQTIFSLLEPGAKCSLKAITIDSGHPVAGLTLEKAFSTRFADGRVIGALPKSHLQELLNEQQDFGTHFKMCFDDEPLLELVEGDLLITVCENDDIARH